MICGGVNNDCFWFSVSKKYTLNALLRCQDFHTCSWVESLTYLLFNTFRSGFHKALAVRPIIRYFQGFHWKDRLWIPTTATESRCRGWCKRKRKIHCLGEKREAAIVLKVRIKNLYKKSGMAQACLPPDVAKCHMCVTFVVGSRNLSDQLQSQVRTNVDMSTRRWQVHVRPHCFIVTEACSFRLELAYIMG